MVRVQEVIMLRVQLTRAGVIGLMPDLEERAGTHCCREDGTGTDL